jgi:hypothetical protein
MYSQRKSALSYKVNLLGGFSQMHRKSGNPKIRLLYKKRPEHLGNGRSTGGICQFESFFTALFSASAFFFSAAALGGLRYYFG